jgi:peptidoglycan DL-endopeptidase CwlO
VPATRTPPRSSSSGTRSSTASRGGTKRPVLSAAEMQALREALALRQTLAAGQTLTPEQAAAVRVAAAAAARTGSARTGQPARRTAATGRTSSGRPARRAPARKPASRTKAPKRPATPRTGARWSTRLRVVALSTVLLPAVATLALPGPQEPGQGGGPLDVTALALTAQSSLLEQAGQYRRLEQEAAQRTAELQQAREAEQAALAQVVAEQQVVGQTAAGLYRAAPDARYPMLGVTVHDDAATSEALFRQALVERSDRALEGAVARAERTGTTLEAATGRVAAAQSAVDAVTRKAAGLLAAARAAAGDLGTEVSSRLAGLGTIPSSGAQQERNAQAMARWQAYLAQLAAAGIEPPPAAELADAGDLPAGMSPALGAGGSPVPGIAWAVIGSSPFTVLSAETVAAVSAALSQLGKPFVPGTSGPETYDCGGFTAAAWLLAGYAVPATPQDQWATGTPVPLADLQIGDLVFAPGGQDVGIYLGDGDVLGASAGSYQVGVRGVATGSSATRVTLPAPAEPNAALPAGGGTGACGAALPVPGKVSAAWGGWANGQIPPGMLCELGVYRHALRCDAAASYAELGAAYHAAFGAPLCITDSYRSLGAQIAAFYRKPALAAVPGTSNHGWALAVDLCGGINIAGSAQWTWMTANAGRFGFVQPDWAGPGGEKPEPWHWEFGYIS